MSKQKTLQPNRLKLATTELKGFVDAKNIPDTINAGESTEYVFIGVKSRDNSAGTAKVHESKMLYAPQGKYQQMVKEMPRFKGLFNGMFNLVIILHDPTLPNVKEKGKGISPTAKGKIKVMFKEDGIPVEEIAKVLGLDIEKVKEYTDKL